MKTITYDPKMHALVRKSLLEDVRRTLDEMIDAAPQQEAREAEHNSKDRRCECCGHMTYHREHLGCIRAAARAHQPPPAQAEGQEAVAYLVEGWSEGKLIAKTLEHTADEARATAAVFTQHYPFIHTHALYTRPPRREWMGLTTDDRLEILRANGEAAVMNLTEAKLKERNHG